MATGETTTTSLADSLPTIINNARIVREFVGVVPNLVDKQTLPEGSGLSWNEVSYAALTAQAVTETSHLNNPQEISDTLLTLTPTQVGIHTIITDRVQRRITKNGLAKLGQLAGNAMQRKKDEDGITTLDGATTSLVGAGATLTSGHIAAAKYRITSNATEPGNEPIYCVLHGFQIKDLYDEFTAAVGDTTGGMIPEGITGQTLRNSFSGTVAGVDIFEDGNISIDASDDAKGGVFAKEAIILVQGYKPRTVNMRNEKYGGGADELLMYDEYVYGERSSGNWLFEIYSDATAPTS